ncbi:MAG: 30S ribosomal protein S2 [Candidatus Aenigmatarchaeota archaeon]|nr:30S ribosomal protein S2 [Candidatus Aenigmarchaeota archaeon]
MAKKKLKEKEDEIENVEIDEEDEKSKKKSEDLLVSREKYLKCGIHIGTSIKTNDMRRFIYKIITNGLAVMNLKMIDNRIRIVSKFLASKKDILVVSRKIKKPVETFAKAIGANAIIGRFMPGTLTNPKSKNFAEPEVILITDPYLDKQAVKEGVEMRIPIIALCNTFNSTSFVDIILPCNNKGRKSVALIFYLLTREILKERGEIKSDEEFKLRIEDFIEEKK